MAYVTCRSISKNTAQLLAFTVSHYETTHHYRSDCQRVSTLICLFEEYSAHMSPVTKGVSVRQTVGFIHIRTISELLYAYWSPNNGGKQSEWSPQCWLVHFALYTHFRTLKFADVLKTVFQSQIFLCPVFFWKLEKISAFLIGISKTLIEWCVLFLVLYIGWIVWYHVENLRKCTALFLRV